MNFHPTSFNQTSRSEKIFNILHEHSQQNGKNLAIYIDFSFIRVEIISTNLKERKPQTVDEIFCKGRKRRVTPLKVVFHWFKTPKGYYSKGLLRRTGSASRENRLGQFSLLLSQNAIFCIDTQYWFFNFLIGIIFHVDRLCVCITR